MALAAEVCDGWIPMGFRPDMMATTYREQLETGFAKRDGGKPGRFRDRAVVDGRHHR